MCLHAHGDRSRFTMGARFHELTGLDGRCGQPTGFRAENLRNLFWVLDNIE
jgi:hypothetical protein